MRVVNDEQLKALKSKKVVNPSEADRLLSASRKKSAPPRRKQALDQLVLTVADAVATSNVLNKRATDLLKDMFVRVSTPAPTPTIIFPEPARKWRVTVTERDTRSLIKTVDLERVDEE